MVKYTIRWECDIRKYPYVKEKMGTNFPGSLNSLDFTLFSNAMGNWRGNPCISHIIKYTIGCKSNGKRTSILWEKYEYQFPRFPTYHGFYKIFLRANLPRFSIRWVFLSFAMLWESDEKNHAFPIWWSIPKDGNLMESPILWKKYWIQFPRPSQFNGFCWLF